MCAILPARPRPGRRRNNGEKALPRGPLRNANEREARAPRKNRIRRQKAASQGAIPFPFEAAFCRLRRGAALWRPAFYKNYGPSTKSPVKIFPHSTINNLFIYLSPNNHLALINWDCNYGGFSLKYKPCVRSKIQRTDKSCRFAALSPAPSPAHRPPRRGRA